MDIILVDTFQAIAGSWLLPKAKQIANQKLKTQSFLIVSSLK